MKPKSMVRRGRGDGLVESVGRRDRWLMLGLGGCKRGGWRWHIQALGLGDWRMREGGWETRR